MAESFGEPGQRTFRLLVGTVQGSVSLWLEKEQLAMLGSAIGDLLRRIPKGQGRKPESDALDSFSGDLEVRVGSLAVGYDESQSGFTVEATDFVTPLTLTSISFLANRKQFSELGDEIERIVVAGRPRCPLCGRPISGGAHFCPESNGHARLTKSAET
jgi:uncharacterized repeat protein (TIGR03847 family)